jgi:hypothetical protein
MWSTWKVTTSGECYFVGNLEIEVNTKQTAVMRLGAVQIPI